MISSGIVDSIRNKEGNLIYEYFFPMDDENTVLLIDSWQDQSSIDKHHDSPIMNEIIKLREKYDLHMKVERYILDDKDIPQSDLNFIRK